MTYEGDLHIPDRDSRELGSREPNSGDLGGRVVEWLKEHPRPTDSELAAAGWVAPSWPEPWGHGASPAEAVAVEFELRSAGVTLPDNPIGIGWAGPTILAAGTEAQKQRYLSSILSNSEHWCQLFSEPDAGSDLASLRTTAERDGDEWVLNGQKIWTTGANFSQFGILLARTDSGTSDRDAATNASISYFLCPMDTVGIEVRVIMEMSGGSHFCEVFFSNARIPADSLLGSEGEGWRLATLTLGNERVTLSQGGLLWGMGPTGPEVLHAIALYARRFGLSPTQRQDFARLHTEEFLLERLGEMVRQNAAVNGRPGPEASLEKLLSDQHGQRLFELLHDVAQMAGVAQEPDHHSAWPAPVARVADEPVGAGLGARHHFAWPWAALFSRALTIGGGTTQIQRNIIAERILGLPREQGASRASL